jgi:hypothetical protein
MSKVKHGLWVVALLAVMVASPVWADETSAAASWFGDLVAQIVAVVAGEGEDSAVQNAASPGDEPELGELVPVNG